MKTWFDIFIFVKRSVHMCSEGYSTWSVLFVIAYLASCATMRRGLLYVLIMLDIQACGVFNSLKCVYSPLSILL